MSAAVCISVSMRATQSPTLAPLAMISAKFSVKPTCLRSRAVVFNTAHRTSESDFFCEKANARRSEGCKEWKEAFAVQEEERRMQA